MFYKIFIKFIFGPADPGISGFWPGGGQNKISGGTVVLGHLRAQTGKCQKSGAWGPPKKWFSYGIKKKPIFWALKWPKKTLIFGVFQVSLGSVKFRISGFWGFLEKRYKPRFLTIFNDLWS